MPKSPRLILIPGLGADFRMFGPQRAAIPNLETPAWIPHIARESLRAYAGRLARSLDIREPVVLGGVSMGGMMAMEIARVAPARCVILIASSRNPSAANPLLRFSERAIRLVPSMVLDRGRALAPLFLGLGGNLSSDERRLSVAMARELPIDFLRWAARAVVEWEGCADPGVPVHHIHGDHDWVFPVRKVKPDRIVPGGVHVLNLSHPHEVNAFVVEKGGIQRAEPRR